MGTTIPDEKLLVQLPPIFTTHSLIGLPFLSSSISPLGFRLYLNTSPTGELTPASTSVKIKAIIIENTIPEIKTNLDLFQ